MLRKPVVLMLTILSGTSAMAIEIPGRGGTFFGLFDVSYGFQYGTRRAGNHVDHSYKSSVVSIASGSCSGC
ncbi:hypothetical protein, partial [Thiolapillus sp.]|uniref:hypothetical protein n=1 Tax=Thiolapillus sp. TaxID=2017437 RepID=UPI003AF554EC